MTKPEFPNDWPTHFNESMVFSPITSAAPAGSNKLWFQGMDYQQFEQFCWFLLQKDYHLEGCQHIGVSGTKQAGIDLFARDKFNTSQLIVFECKCWKEFNKAELKNAINNFLDSPWIRYKPKFILILAQEELGNISEAWVEQSTRLDELGIKSDVWTGKHLTARVQHFPDIVTRFFTALTAQNICHDWMRRVRFIERLHYAYAEKNKDIREIVEEFMRDTETGEIVDIEKFKLENTQNSNIDRFREELKQRLINLVNNENSEHQVNENVEDNPVKGIDDKKNERFFYNDGNWTINHPAIYIHCLIPSKRMYPTSTLIKFSQENASGVDVTLRQKWMLEYLLGAEGTPANSKYRPFIVGEFNSKSVQHTIIQLQNCRIYPRTDMMKEICGVIDQLSQVVTSELLKLEKEWDAVGFPFVQQGGLTYVGICTMPKWLWNLILEFGVEHDVSKGKTEWHIFDQSRHSLKVFTNKAHPDFDLGYHSIFFGRDDLDGANYGDTIVVMWQPPDSIQNYAVDGRKWMPCDFAFKWLTEKLLPKVKESMLEREISKHGIFKKVTVKKDFSNAWSRGVEIGELRQFSFLRNERYWEVGLVNSIAQLQHSIDTHGREIYLTKEDVKIYTKHLY